MRSTQKDIIAYGLGNFFSQTAPEIADAEGYPTASVRRCLRELVQEGRAKFIARDWFGNPGYVAVRRGRRRAS